MRLNQHARVSSGFFLSGVLAFSATRCSEGKLGTPGDDGGARTDAAKDGSLLAPTPQPQFGTRGPLNVFGPPTDRYGMGDLAKSRSTPAD